MFRFDKIEMMITGKKEFIIDNGKLKEGAMRKSEAIKENDIMPCVNKVFFTKRNKICLFRKRWYHNS